MASVRWSLLLLGTLSAFSSRTLAAPPIVVPHQPAVPTFDASPESLPNPATLPFPSGCKNATWDFTNTKDCLMPRIDGVIYDGPRFPAWDPTNTWGRWQIRTTRDTTPIIGIQVAHVPGTDAYLFLGRSSTVSFDNDGDVVAGVFNYNTNQFRNVSTSSNPFCGGLSVMHDGRVMTAGGTTAERAGGMPDGRRVLRIYDYQANPTVLPDTVMLRYDRWYPTVTLLADNNMFIMGGTKTATEKSSPNPWFERWLSFNDTNYPLPRHAIDPSYLPEMAKQFYPAMFVLPTSEVFILQDQYSRIIKPNGLYRTVIDPATGTAKSLQGPLYTFKWKTQFPFLGMVAMMPLTYENNYGSVDIVVFGGGKYPDTTDAVLYCLSTNNTAKTTPAGSFSYRMTISWAWVGNDWQYTFSDWTEESMGVPRVGGDAVLLPNGDTVLVGGAQTGCSCGIRSGVNRGNYPALWPVLYQPDRPVGERYTVLTAGSIARMYHGTAALTTEGTLLIQGCDACEKKQLVTTAAWWSGSPDGRWEFRIEEFFPPYALDVNAKPKITAINGGTNTITAVNYGQTFTISWAPLVDGVVDVAVTKVSLVAPSAVTHGFNTNQRVVFLRIVSQTDNTVTVQVPSTIAVLPPQIYKLFIMNGKTYSKAAWVKLTKPGPVG